MLAKKRGRPSIYIVREGFGARAAHVELGGCVSDPHALRVWGHLLRLDRPCWIVSLAFGWVVPCRRLFVTRVLFGVTSKKARARPPACSEVCATAG